MVVRSTHLLLLFVATSPSSIRPIDRIALSNSQYPKVKQLMPFFCFVSLALVGKYCELSNMENDQVAHCGGVDDSIVETFCVNGGVCDENFP